MENEKEFSPQESLRVIQSMIEHTKGVVANDSFYFLMWGWLVFGICVIQYVLLEIGSPYHYYAWTLIWLGVIISVIYGIKNRRKEKVRTYTDEAMKFIWIAVGVSFFVLGWICSLLKAYNCFSLFIMLYAIGTFLSGSFLRFRPLVIGGILCWIIAIITAFFAYKIQILLTAVSLLVSYIIPGYLLRAKYKSQQV